MEQYLNFNRMKALYILILWTLLRKFDIGANKRKSFFYTIAGIGSRQISTKNHPPLRTGQTSGLDSVHIGTIRKILSSWWFHIKLTHSRMSGIMNGMGSYLLVYGELQPAVLVGSSAALMGRLETEFAQKAHSGIVDAVQFP